MICILLGTEPYLIDEKKSEIMHRALKGDVNEFSFTSYDMEEDELQTAISDAETISFMGGDRVILIKNAYFLTGSDKTKLEHDLERLLHYMKHETPQTTLIITVPAEKLDARKKVVKELKKNAEHIVCNPLPPNQINSFIRKKATDYNANITSDAIQRLIMLLGGNLQSIDKELEKLGLFANGKSIDEDMVTNMISRNLEQDVFLLSDLIVKKQLQQAHQVLVDLLKKKEEPIKILALLASKFRLILQVKILSLKGYPQRKIASELGMHPYPVQLACEQSRYFEEEELSKLLCNITKIDFKMKTGQTDKVLALESFMMSLSRL